LTLQPGSPLFGAARDVNSVRDFWPHTFYKNKTQPSSLVTARYLLLQLRMLAVQQTACKIDAKHTKTRRAWAMFGREMSHFLWMLTITRMFYEGVPALASAGKW
jgi:hypothetical protein